jgi:hypothetical protein
MRWMLFQEPPTMTRLALAFESFWREGRVMKTILHFFLPGHTLPALMFIREEDWFFVLIEEGGFSSIAFWEMTIMLRGRRGILLGGISASGLVRMMTGGWIGM